MPYLRFLRQRPSSSSATATERAHGLVSQEAFLEMLVLERKRADRSARRFILMLVEAKAEPTEIEEENAIKAIRSALFHSTRETDIKGWYEQDAVIGVLFTELGATLSMTPMRAIEQRVTQSLREHLGTEPLGKLKISFYPYPEDSERAGLPDSSDSPLYPDLARSPGAPRHARILKRMIDILGSLFALAVGLPILLIIAALIKLTSKGPVLFCQDRVGQYGRRFKFLKFRSMVVNNDPSVHMEYVRRFIGAQVNVPEPNAQMIFKLTEDPRITAIGRFLRKTSLDEVPQFLNVLLGHMSLVGPRPPLPYEFESYSVWHRKRLLSVKPGITGLWQVEGRSTVPFNEMVRLDLQYARHWSVWLDMKILLKTPGAVFMGHGAH